MVGQPRAHQALLFGFQTKESGFNIFAAGPPATGKTVKTIDFLEDMAKKKSTPPDWCYVHNFEDEYHPLTLSCPPGLGRQLRQDMQELIQAARIAIPQLFEGEDYVAKRDQILKKTNQQRQEDITKMSRVAEEEGFSMQLTAIGISLFPLRKGRPLSEEEFLALSKDEREKFAQKREDVKDKLTPLLRQLRDLETEARKELSEFDKDVALYAIDHLMSKLLDKYVEHSEITTFLRNSDPHCRRLRQVSGQRI